MTRLVRAELLKLFTTRLMLVLALLTLVLIAFVTVVRVLSTPDSGLSTLGEQRSIAQFASAGAVVSVIVGIMLAAGEWAHGTIAHTFLVAPSRARVVAAKVVAGAVGGVVLTAFAEIATWLIAAALLAAEPVPFRLATREIVTTYLGILLAGALAAALGVGLGALLRRQTGAIVLALLWPLVVVPVLGIAGVGKYEPANALASVAVARSDSSGTLLAFGPGLALALLWVAGFALAGTVAVNRSDIT